MLITPDELYTLGNKQLLTTTKALFFCSREYPHTIAQAVYQWVLEQQCREWCIISGFHSVLEREVLRYLLRVGHPIIYVLGRGIQSTMRYTYETELAADQLLFVSPFETSLANGTQETTLIRNMLLVELADELFVPYLSPGSSLEPLVLASIAEGKIVRTLDIAENQDLLRWGATIYHPKKPPNQRLAQGSLRPHAVTAATYELR